MHAGRSTAKANSAMQDVMNHPQVQMGMHMNVMPLARRSSVVAMKLSAPSSEAIQKMAMDKPHRLAPHCIPGPASLPMALSGVYSVQPAMGGPSGMTNASIRTTQARKVIQKDIMLKRGKAMSSAPI